MDLNDNATKRTPPGAARWGPRQASLRTRGSRTGGGNGGGDKRRVYCKSVECTYTLRKSSEEGLGRHEWAVSFIFSLTGMVSEGGIYRRNELHILLRFAE